MQSLVLGEIVVAKQMDTKNSHGATHCLFGDRNRALGSLRVVRALMVPDAFIVHDQMNHRFLIDYRRIDTTGNSESVHRRQGLILHFTRKYGTIGLNTGKSESVRALVRGEVRAFSISYDDRFAPKCP